MDLAGWVQVLSITGALIAIFGFYGALVKSNTKIKASTDSAHKRIDEMTGKECPMGIKIEERVEDHEVRLKTIEASRLDNEKWKGKVDEKLDNIEKALIDIKKAVTK